MNGSRSRLQPGQAPPAGLRVVLAGSSNVACINAEGDRITRDLVARGHTVTTHFAEGRVGEPGLFEHDFTTLGDVDLVVVLGGDGSILRTVSWMGHRQVPVLAVNLGRLGFLADYQPDELKPTLDEITAGRFRLVKHLLLEFE
ncbi:MAG: NAD(+)/NADH kinase, partial [Pirellulales bacterium]